MIVRLVIPDRRPFLKSNHILDTRGTTVRFILLLDCHVGWYGSGCATRANIRTLGAT